MFDKSLLINKTIDFVKQTLAEDTSGHDWWHIYRVWKMACYLAEEENANGLIVELAALLHDIADWKFHNGDLEASATVANTWLLEQQVDAEVIKKVCHIINNVTFKGANVPEAELTLEGKIVQDADRLDAIGAIGIARVFTYGGYKGQSMHDPDLPLEFHDSFEAYKNKNTTAINHFYEKLLLLKDRVHTKTAKKIALERHQFMQMYLAQFHAEWNV